jgi:hypothetical protein
VGIRETYNFFKHADRDRDSELYVGEIVKTNILQLGLCVVNYRAVFGGWTDHMKLLFNVAKLISPSGFVHEDQRVQFDAAIAKMADVNLAELLSGWWDHPRLIALLPNLGAEKFEDLRDTRPVYDVRVSSLTDHM